MDSLHELGNKMLKQWGLSPQADGPTETPIFDALVADFVRGGGNRPVTQAEQDANNLSNVIATLGDSAFFSVDELPKDLEQHKKSPLLSVSNDGTIGENPTRGTDSNGFKDINNFPSTS